MATLHEKLTHDLELAGYARSTRDIYFSSVLKLEAFHGRGAEALSQDDVRVWVADLVRSSISPQRLRQHYSAATFVYKRTLARPSVVSFLSWPRDRSRAPQGLSRDETKKLLRAFHTPRFQAFYATIYATALRVGEACLLQTRDIDSARGIIHVRNGKRDGERVVMLSPRLLALLREYWRLVRPAAPWLFASRRGTHLHAGVARGALARASREASISRHVTPHMLRHTAATHMLEDGVDIRVIQAVLGHSSIRSTVRYAQVSWELVGRTPSPLDRLEQ
jgi:integrase/recombinase XerD